LNTNKYISSLHYITQDTDAYTHPQLAERACIAGVEWVQLRIKDKPDAEVLMLAKQTKAICDKYNATLIINDKVHIAKAINAGGVHLGKNDMDVAEARKIVGNDFIIGGTANTFEDIKKLYNDGVDYIGLGPFRFTTTKKNLSPVLGLEGYQKIIEQCNRNNINIPIIAIGGITTEDVDDIYSCGVYGIAVSGAITFSKNLNQTVAEFKRHNY
jgi:thiamine-phosphate pyrophosphorylase